jgi:hypothetical protein
MKSLMLFILNFLIVLIAIGIIGVIGLYLSGSNVFWIHYRGSSYGIDGLLGVSPYIWLLAFLLIFELGFLALRSLMKHKKTGH